MSVRTGVNEYNQPISDINSGHIGEFKYFGFESVPPHCLACDGSEISRATYSELFEVFGETYGAGDGETTFNLPDFRGAFLRCIGGNAAALGVEQGDAIREIEGNLHNYVGLGTPNPDGAFILYRQQAGGNMVTSGADNTVRYTITTSFRASNVVPISNENRPLNYAVNICVIYE